MLLQIILMRDQSSTWPGPFWSTEYREADREEGRERRGWERLDRDALDILSVLIVELCSLYSLAKPLLSLPPLSFSSFCFLSLICYLSLLSPPYLRHLCSFSSLDLLSRCVFSLPPLSSPSVAQPLLTLFLVTLFYTLSSSALYSPVSSVPTVPASWGLLGFNRKWPDFAT